MKKVLFMGRKNVAAKLLQYFELQNDITIIGVLTDNHLEGSPVAAVARNLKIPVYEYDEVIDLLRSGELEFDLGISILYWKKLKDEYLTHPVKGIINFHPAPLPSYKGTGGYNLAILETKKSWGVTAHYINRGIDTGNIIEVSEFKIDTEKETVVSLERKSMEAIETLAKKIIAEAIRNDTLLPSIENVGGRYVSRSEMEAMKLIQPGDDIERKIRAFWFPPYHGACIEIKNVKYTLVSEYILDSLAPDGATSLFAKNVIKS